MFFTGTPRSDVVPSEVSTEETLDAARTAIAGKQYEASEKNILANPAAVIEGDLRLCQIRLSKERTAWYCFDSANSLVSALAFTFVVPLLLAKVAELTAYSNDLSQLPDFCEVQAEDRGSSWTVNCENRQCFLQDLNNLTDTPPLIETCLQCVRGSGKLLWRVNATSGELATASGELIAYVARVPFLWTEINYISYSTWIISLAVFAQAITYIAIGPSMDYGKKRKGLLIGSTVLGAIFCALFITAQGSHAYILLGILTILVSVCFGVGVVAYNSYLPILVDSHMKICASNPNPTRQETEELRTFRTQHMNDMSNFGFIIGYAGQMVGMIIGLGIILAMKQSSAAEEAEMGYLGYRMSMLFIGAWWLLWAIPSILWLKPRQSRHQPTTGVCGTLTFGFRVSWQSLKLAWKYSQTVRYFLTYFFFSDMASTIPTVGLLLASEELCMSLWELIILAFITPIMAIVGLFLVSWIVRASKGAVSVKAVLISCLLTFSVMSLYGLCGVFTNSFGMHHKWEVYLFSGFMGLLIGPVQSSARQMFSDLIPLGHESAFFSLYEITERGSSFVGPAIVGLVKNADADIRYTFIYLLIVAFFPAMSLWIFVDHQKGAMEVGRLQSRTSHRALQHSLQA